MESLERQVVDVLSEIVAINSVNPDLEQGAGGEEAVAAVIERHCREMGLDVSRHTVLPGRDNVLATLTVPDAKQTLLFESHMDTVAISSMGDRALRPEIRGGRLYGRGACDDKGSLAAMLVAVTALAGRRNELRANLMLLSAIDEEFKFRGVLDFINRKIPVHAAIVGEPTENRLVVNHNGVIRWKVSTIGRAAHTSRPHLGVSAIEHMVEIITALRALQSKYDARPHPLVGPAKLTVGTIHGGIAVNIVPDRCTIEIDRRVIPGEKHAEVLAEINALLGEVVTRNPDIRIESEQPMLLTPALATPWDSPIVKAAQQACRQSGVSDELAGVPFGSDASKLWEYGGVPSIVLGPGSIDQAHTADEYVPIEQLTKAVQIYIDTALAFA